MSADPADLDLHKLAGNAVSYRLELMEVVPPGGYVREDWELSWAEKASAVPELKAAGNSLFALGDHAAAAAEYHTAIRYLEGLELAVASAELLPVRAFRTPPPSSCRHRAAKEAWGVASAHPHPCALLTDPLPSTGWARVCD